MFLKEIGEVSVIVTVIEFPVVPRKRQLPGASPVYVVTADQVVDWQRDFPHLNIEAEVRKARAWCVANVSKRKTAQGMPRFLVGWFMRAEGSGSMERRVGPRRASTVPTGSIWTKRYQDSVKR